MWVRREQRPPGLRERLRAPERVQVGLVFERRKLAPSPLRHRKRIEINELY